MLHSLESDHLPLPSAVNSSGRGLQARWNIDFVPRDALPRWNAVQRELVAMLSGYGADRAASDASRVLRIVDSINSKSGSRVKTVHVTHDAEGMPIRYGFDFLCEHFLKKTREQLDDDERAKRNEIDHPYSDEQKARMAAARLRREAGKVRPKSGKSKSPISGLPGSQLAWNRLEDLRTLFSLREGRMTGHSMSLLFWSLTEEAGK